MKLSVEILGQEKNSFSGKLDNFDEILNCTDFAFDYAERLFSISIKPSTEFSIKRWKATMSFKSLNDK